MTIEYYTEESRSLPKEDLSHKQFKKEAFKIPGVLEEYSKLEVEFKLPLAWEDLKIEFKNNFKLIGKIKK